MICPIDSQMKRLEEIFKELPTTTSVIGEAWLFRNRDWAEDYISAQIGILPSIRFYQQLEWVSGDTIPIFKEGAPEN
jgi:hypothetical protein